MLYNIHILGEGHIDPIQNEKMIGIIIKVAVVIKVINFLYVISSDSIRIASTPSDAIVLFNEALHVTVLSNCSSLLSFCGYDKYCFTSVHSHFDME